MRNHSTEFDKDKEEEVSFEQKVVHFVNMKVELKLETNTTVKVKETGRDVVADNILIIETRHFEPIDNKSRKVIKNSLFPQIERE